MIKLDLAPAAPAELNIAVGPSITEPTRSGCWPGSQLSTTTPAWVPLPGIPMDGKQSDLFAGAREPGLEPGTRPRPQPRKGRRRAQVGRPGVGEVRMRVNRTATLVDGPGAN
jgi:hypothetical protein